MCNKVNQGYLLFIPVFLISPSPENPLGKCCVGQSHETVPALGFVPRPRVAGREAVPEGCSVPWGAAPGALPWTLVGSSLLVGTEAAPRGTRRSS